MYVLIKIYGNKKTSQMTTIAHGNIIFNILLTTIKIDWIAKWRKLLENTKKTSGELEGSWLNIVLKESHMIVIDFKQAFKKTALFKAIIEKEELIQ